MAVDDFMSRVEASGFGVERSIINAQCVAQCAVSYRAQVPFYSVRHVCRRGIPQSWAVLVWEGCLLRRMSSEPPIRLTLASRCFCLQIALAGFGFTGDNSIGESLSHSLLAIPA